MEYVYAALLLDAAGKEVTEQGLMEVIKAAGFTPEEARAKAMVASLKGITIKDVIKNAQSMQMQAAAPSAAPAGAAPVAPKKDAEAEKKSEEEAASGLASLFG
jgi:large subunit ribosomal protein L12